MKVAVPPESTVALAGEMVPPVPAVAVTSYVTGGELPDDPPPQALNSIMAVQGTVTRSKLAVLVMALDPLVLSRRALAGGQRERYHCFVTAA